MFYARFDIGHDSAPTFYKSKSEKTIEDFVNGRGYNTKQVTIDEMKRINQYEYMLKYAMNLDKT